MATYECVDYGAEFEVEEGNDDACPECCSDITAEVAEPQTFDEALAVFADHARAVPGRGSSWSRWWTPFAAWRELEPFPDGMNFMAEIAVLFTRLHRSRRRRCWQ